MSLTTTVQDWMRDVGDRENSAVIARAHVAAETSTDVDRICATISHDVYFGVPVRTRDGNELRSGSVLTTYDQVRGYYEGRAGSYVVLESAQLKSISTEWYLFNETAATLRGTGMVNGIDASGKEWIVNSAVIFPTAAGWDPGRDLHHPLSHGRHRGRDRPGPGATERPADLDAARRDAARLAA